MYNVEKSRIADCRSYERNLYILYQVLVREHHGLALRGLLEVTKSMKEAGCT